jgi:hypothetical protein
MAARLRQAGYPASNYLETGTTGGVTWSLQTVSVATKSVNGACSR